MDLKFEVKNNRYTNIKEILKVEFAISSRLYLKLRNNNKIFLNGKSDCTNKTLSIGDIVEVDLSFNEVSSSIVSTKMDLNIIYEDKYLLIIDKPSNIAVHPSLRHFDNSLSNGIKFYFDNNKINTKIRIVNRLDKDTTGIVIFAKNEYVQESLIVQMANHTFIKEYIGILAGEINPKSGIINAPIARKQGSIIERCIDNLGQSSITHYNVIKEVNGMSLTHFILETGRTHQIRVHAKFILGYPIVGDTLYGTPSSLISRQALHSYKVSFVHPITKEKMEFVADIPEDMKFI